MSLSLTVSRFRSLAAASLVCASLVVTGCATRPAHDSGGAAEFAGAWALADTEGDLFDVVVHEDGSAVTNWSKGASGARGERGTWTIVDGGAGLALAYDSGWRDVITRSHDGYSKKSYGPGVPVSAEPTNAGRAIRVRGPLRPFVGVWEMTAEGSGAVFHVAMKSDGTARKTVNSAATGKWSVADGVARVEWSDGWRLAIHEESGGGFVREEWNPKASAAKAPTSRSRCHPVGGVPAGPPGE